MQLDRQASLVFVALAASACASTQTPSQVCDYVFFSRTNCVEEAKPRPLLASRGTMPVSRSTAPVVAREQAKEEPATPPTPPPPAPPPEIPPINAIYFDIGKDNLSGGTRLTLKAIATYLSQVKNESVKLVAYTDPVGSVQRNKEIAASRANAVAEFLQAHDIDASRIEIAPYSMTKASPLPTSEYWRLRKVAVLYGPETMARLQKDEDESDAHAENDIKADPVESRPAEARTVSKLAPKTDDGKPKLENIDVIYWRSQNHALFILAKKLGFFEQEGFNVRLHESGLEANELTVKLADEVGRIKTVLPRSAMDLKSRHYFLGAVCPYGFHEAISKKLPFVEIGSMLNIANSILMKKEMVEAVRKNLRNFKGKIGRVKGMPNEIDTIFLFSDRLRQVGLKEGTDFSFAYYDNWSAMYDGLFKGEIDAALCQPPLDTELTGRNAGYGMLLLSQLNLNLPCCRQLVTRDNLKRNREKYVRFERAVIRAQRYLVEHPNEAIEIISKFLNRTPATIRAYMQRPGYALSANPNVKGSVAFAEVMKTRLGPGKVGDIRESMDTSVYEDALTSLVKEDPANPAFNAMLDTYKRTR